ncbi:hypothetical protein M9H77_07634 [Catharanthus roseus]|uniref:Uncharacterized protein n=1 Tax=Catharanthus roseus TaxID=4058 RepID=A0ACC0BVH6_CATRO|nr:hypothetical protein M9H77_07634 [Catharanthus roseus]
MIYFGYNMYLSVVGKIRMRETIASCTGGTSGRADDEGAGFNDVPPSDDEEEGVKMGAGLEYDNYGNGVKVVGGIDVVVGEADVPIGIEDDVRRSLWISPFLLTPTYHL